MAAPPVDRLRRGDAVGHQQRHRDTQADPGVFEMLRRAADVAFANCLVIDCDRRTLDAARSLGMSTALYGTSPAGQPITETSHPAVGDFTNLLRRG